jgi:hypothetical protein
VGYWGAWAVRRVNEIMKERGWDIFGSFHGDVMFIVDPSRFPRLQF